MFIKIVTNSLIVFLQFILETQSNMKHKFKKQKYILATNCSVDMQVRYNDRGMLTGMM